MSSLLTAALEHGVRQNSNGGTENEQGEVFGRGKGHYLHARRSDKELDVLLTRAS